VKFSNQHGENANSFDEEFDVIVVGYGFAGGTAAIEACDAGARVLLIEKMPDPGGISICAGGGLRVAKTFDDAYAYLSATNAGATPDDVLRVFARELTTLEQYFRGLASVNGAVIGMRDRETNYPLPGSRGFQFLEVDSVPGFDGAKAYPFARALRNGPNVFKVVEDNIRRRPIEVRLATGAYRLIPNQHGEVGGVITKVPTATRAIKARHGVILACGGFEANHSMQRQYWHFNPVLSAVSLGNTGDGIRMAMEAGADLWHMWHFHGSYGFRHPDPAYPVGLRMKRLPDWTPGSKPPETKMSWILLGKNGRRFMNECPPYVQDTGHQPLNSFDPVTQSFPYVPAYALVDEEGRKLYPLAKMVYNDRNAKYYEWSNDNLKEVERGILHRAESIAELATLMKVDAATLGNTLERWNAQCANGHDEDFGRSAGTMTKIATPPFYFGEVWPVVSNTQGGPVHDTEQRVLNPFGEPIPRLYVAGELGSIWGHLYLSGGNLSECFITGRIAGRHAAGLPPT
jgi:succinate dehydrogenase/fumarate reductase flavoprotein subunit